MAKTKIELTDIAPIVSPSRRDDVMQMLGAARYVEWLHSQTASHLMQFLITVEKDKLYIDAGHPTFAEFLNRSGLKSKSAFYRQRELYLKEGPEQHDLFEDWNIPQSTRRLLESGDITIEGDEVVIGGEERVSLTNSGSIKAILEQLVREKIKIEENLRDTDSRLASSETRIEKLKKIETDYDQLREALDHGTPYEQAYLGLMKAFVVMVAEVKEMSDDEREDRAEPDMATFGEQWRQLSEAYEHGLKIYAARVAKAGNFD